MLTIYQTYKYDWLGYEIDKNCKITKHHIFKKVYGGENNIKNYALLITTSHEYLHSLERTNHHEYIELNKLFQELNDSFAPPTKEYYEKVEKILKKVRK